MTDLAMPLSWNFTLHELVRSTTAERDPLLKRQQENPPEEVIQNLRYLAEVVLQPLREELAIPLRITSGYRCPALNQRIGGSATSQHCLGQAADCQIDPEFLTDERTSASRRQVAASVESATGRPMPANVDQNYYLFAFVCLRVDALDIDQLIHEYGRGYGRPAWVHIASSRARNNRQVLFCGEYTQNKYVSVQVANALSLSMVV